MEDKQELAPCRVRLLKSPSLGSDEVSRWLRRGLNLPCERGPEGKYDCESAIQKDRRQFPTFNPQDHPAKENVPLAPKRDDVPLMDPCSGQLSAGAQVLLGGKRRSPFINEVYTPSHLWTPAGTRNRPQTPPKRPSALLYYNSETQKWNSRKKPDAALMAKLGGWNHGERMTLPTQDTHNNDEGQNPSELFDERRRLAQRYVYTSSTQRGYEEVDWDSKLPPRHRPPNTTLEKSSDPFSLRWLLKRYHSRPELWQAIGGQWNKHQLRPSFFEKKPIHFQTNVPAYTGKDKFNTAQSSAECIPDIAGRTDHRSSVDYRHKTPFSRMVTRVGPKNPFLLPRNF